MKVHGMVLKPLNAIYPVSYDVQQLRTQSTVLTTMPNLDSLESYIQHVFKHESETNEAFLIKITMPDMDRIRALRHLDSMNINHATLFPDITGAAKYANMTLVLEE